MKQLMEGLADEIEGGEGDEVKEADQVKGIGFRRCRSFHTLLALKYI